MREYGSLHNNTKSGSYNVIELFNFSHYMSNVNIILQENVFDSQ
jgi:hypothetical protein